MDNYQIIDEPKPGAYEYLIMDPLIILFVSIFLPLFINLPYFGKWWMPLVWIITNGYFLGSPTIKKETFVAITGLFALICLSVLLITIHNTDETMAQFVSPYYRIFSQAVLFLTMYIIVFYQSVPFSIHEYIKEQNAQ